MRKITSAAFLAACLPCAALAQPMAADPANPVPPVSYRAAFGLPQTLPASTDVNLADWTQANADVGRNLRGHIDILKWEAANTPPSAPEPQASAPLTPAQAVALALKNQPSLVGAPQSGELARTQLDAQVLALSHNVQRAWVNAVAAQQALAHERQVASAAQTGAELGQRMARVGNWSRAQLLQEQLVQAAALSQLALAQQTAFGATEDLVRLLGLWGSAAQLNLPTQLPPRSTAAIDASDVEAAALRHQPELMQARLDAAQAATGVTQSHLNQWQQATDAAIREATQAALTSALPSIKTDTSANVDAFGPPPNTPVLDPRQVPLTHALERAVRTQAKAHTLAVATRSQAREAYFRYRTAVDLAQHQRAAAALSAALQDEVQLRYNGMLQSTWDLLASARARLQSERSAHDAERDAWLAYIDLQAVLSGAVVNFSSPNSAAGTTAAAKPGH